MHRFVSNSGFNFTSAVKIFLRKLQLSWYIFLSFFELLEKAVDD